MNLPVLAVVSENITLLGPHTLQLQVLLSDSSTAPSIKSLPVHRIKFTVTGLSYNFPWHFFYCIILEWEHCIFLIQPVKITRTSFVILFLLCHFCLFRGSSKQIHRWNVGDTS